MSRTHQDYATTIERLGNSVLSKRTRQFFANLRWVPGDWSLGRRRALLLSARQFERELCRERIRATRRHIPFCLVTLKVITPTRRGGSGSGRAFRQMVGVLYRHLRVTDEKGWLGPNRCGVLLVDTPEMGGRTVVDRLSRLFDAAGLAVEVHLQVHDPDGFGGRGDEDLVSTGSRRREDPPNETWVRPRSADADSDLEDPTDTPDHSVPQTARISVMTADSVSPISPGLRRLKRVVDCVGASVGLIVSAPVMLLAMLAIKWEDGGPVFFCQTREGYRGQPFTIFKLRTMIIGAEQVQAVLRPDSHRDGPAFKLKNDPRVTRIGRFLRATCLDELPQLINVLRGEMSLVGPRPLPWHESRACDRWHRRRLDVPPGITCIWQVDKSKAETFDDWMRMDLRYIDRIGVFEDFRLIARTIVVPVTGRGGD